jgi:hypothetical protein
VAFGLQHPELRDEFGGYLNDIVAMRTAAE